MVVGRKWQKMNNKYQLNWLTCLVMMVAWLGLWGSASAALVEDESKHESLALCVYDPLGASGPVYQQMKPFQVVAVDWGLDLELLPYTSERIAAEDFKSGACQGTVLTGLLARQFNFFTGTLDAYGAIPDYEHLRMVLRHLASPKAAQFMVQSVFEVAGLIPAGAAYLYLNDRSMRQPEDFSGKRFAFLESDPGLKQIVMKMGAAPVNATPATMYSQFNNGAIDIVFGPAIVYEAMELHKGLTPNGGVLSYPTAQLTLQMVVRHDAFPEGFGQQARQYWFSQFDRVLKTVKTAESSIEQALWIELSDTQRLQLIEMMRQARLVLRDTDYYHPTLLSLLSQVRCRFDPSSLECHAEDRE